MNLLKELKERKEKRLRAQLEQVDKDKEPDETLKIEEVEEGQPIEKKPESIKEQLSDVREKLEILTDGKKGGRKDKMFKVRWNVRRQLKTLARKDKILIFLLTVNRNIKPVIAKIENGMIVVNGKFHKCSTDFVYLFEGKYPAIVLPEWSLTPIGTADYYRALKDKNAGVEAQQILIRAMEVAATLPSGKKMSGKVLIGIFVAGVVGFYLLFGGGLNGGGGG